MSRKDRFNVSEIFGPTVQGEGVLCGKVSHFIRFAGCPYRCIWCDSLHAVIPERIKEHAAVMDGQQIRDKIVELGGSRTASWVTLSGGDPLMWELGDFIRDYLQVQGFQIAVETQGSFWKEWLNSCDAVTCSPKGPSSGMQDKTDYNVLDKYVKYIGPGFLGAEAASPPQLLNFKVVVFDERDLKFAANLHRRYPDVPFYLSSGTEPPPLEGGDETVNETALGVLKGFRWLVDQTLEHSDFKDVTVLPQMHSLVWGRRLGV